MIKTPCDGCPFRTDARPYLRKGRIAQIESVLRDGGMFPCHKTTRETGTPPEMWCAGALLVLERQGDDLNRNQMVRIYEHTGGLNVADLDRGAPVFDSFEEANDAHSL